MIFAPAPPGLAGLDALHLLAGRSILTDLSEGDARHLVLADNAGRHRLIVRAAGNVSELACVILPDRPTLDARRRLQTKDLNRRLLVGLTRHIA